MPEVTEPVRGRTSICDLSHGQASVLRSPCAQEFTVPWRILPQTLGPGGFWNGLREVKPGEDSE